MAAKRGRKPSEVWQWFTMSDDKKHAACNACEISRCKNVVTLENHMMVCEKLTDDDKAKWDAIVKRREDAPRPPKLARRACSVCPCALRLNCRPCALVGAFPPDVSGRSSVGRLHPIEEESDSDAVPELSLREVDECRTLLCRWVYQSAIPFTVVENKYFRSFLRALRPDFVPPTRLDVANKYLDREKLRLQRDIEKSLKMTGYCTLSIDGAEDKGKEHVSHVCALTPLPHFLGSIRFNTEAETHQAIVKALDPFHQQMVGLGVKVLGIITDNEAKMNLVRKQHNEDYGGCTPGCGPHAGNLVTGDVLKHEQVAGTLKQGKALAEALKNTKLRGFLKISLGVAVDGRVGVPMAGAFCTVYHVGAGATRGPQGRHGGTLRSTCSSGSKTTRKRSCRWRSTRTPSSTCRRRRGTSS